MAFPLGEEKEGVWGEVYVSTDRAAAQAVEYNIPYERELSRLIIHGVLHLMDYEDSSASERQTMRTRETTYLDRLYSSE